MKNYLKLIDEFKSLQNIIVFDIINNKTNEVSLLAFQLIYLADINNFTVNIVYLCLIKLVLFIIAFCLLIFFNKYQTKLMDLIFFV